MVLPLIPIAVGAGIVGSAWLGSAITSFFGSQDKDQDKDVADASSVNKVLDSGLSDDSKSKSLAYLSGVNPNSKFQKTSGLVNVQDDNSSVIHQNTYTYTYNVDSPNSPVSVTPTQKATETKSSSDPLGSFLSSIGGSIIPVAALTVGGFLLYKGVFSKNG